MVVLLAVQGAGAIICAGLAWQNGIRGNNSRLVSLCGLAFIAWIVLFFVTLGRLHA